jgi:hypothetical protein
MYMCQIEHTPFHILSYNILLCTMLFAYYLLDIFVTLVGSYHVYMNVFRVLLSIY